MTFKTLSWLTNRKSANSDGVTKNLWIMNAGCVY